MINIIHHSEKKIILIHCFCLYWSPWTDVSVTLCWQHYCLFLPPSVSQPMVVIPVGPDEQVLCCQRQRFDFSATFKCLDLWCSCSQFVLCSIKTQGFLSFPPLGLSNSRTLRLSNSSSLRIYYWTLWHSDPPTLGLSNSRMDSSVWSSFVLQCALLWPSAPLCTCKITTAVAYVYLLLYIYIFFWNSLIACKVAADGFVGLLRPRNCWISFLTYPSSYFTPFQLFTGY